MQKDTRRLAAACAAVAAAREQAKLASQYSGADWTRDIRVTVAELTLNNIVLEVR